MEQLANLYSTTLAAPYVAGAGAIVVLSATGAPSSGTFCLTILNSSGTVLLIFRVASVAGTTFTGAAEGPDANAAMGSVVVGTMLTVDAINQIKADAIAPSTAANLVLAGPASAGPSPSSFRSLVAADLPNTTVTPGSYTSTNLTVDQQGRITAAANGGGGGGGSFIQALTAPVPGNFSNVNFSGAGVTTTRLDSSTPVEFITLRQQDPTHTGNLAAISKAKVNALFTITAALTITGDSTGGMIAGLWLNDTGTNNIFFGVYLSSGNNGCQVPFISSQTNFNNAGSGESTVKDPFSTAQVQGPLLWLRIQETLTARNYYLSSDGVTFYLIFTESNTAHFTTANYGMGLYFFNGGGTTYDGGLTMYSFTESTP